MSGFIPLKADAGEMAAALDRLPDYRVLRRLEPIERRIVPPVRDDLRWGCALDVETTGLDPSRHSVIELAVQRFVVASDGRIVETGEPCRWLEDPGHPLPPEIVTLTGITDEMVRGRSIGDGQAAGRIIDSDFVVSHNASFDRPFVERRLPWTKGKPWVCSMRDVPWRELGFEGRVLGHLLGQIGWFYDAHRADVDVAAMLRLLDHEVAEQGRSVMAIALANAMAPTWEFEARAAPFEAKDALKARGYRWDAVRRLWWREVPLSEFDEEMEWTVANVYAGRAKPVFRPVDWTSRYAARKEVEGR